MKIKIIIGILFILFILKISIIAVVFSKEIKAARSKDPAAKSFLEVLLLYQGLHALIMHRIAHFFL
jgi:serine acetyltransferase